MSDDTSKTSNDLAHLLSPAESVDALRDELENDAIALRIGRAFLKGRLDKLEGVVSGEEFPFPSVDECNLYAGGYQYDDPQDPMSEIADLLSKAKSTDEPELKEAAGIMERLAALEKLEAEGGLTLQILSERTDLRFTLQMMTLTNVQSSLMLQQSVGTLKDQLSQLRRPMATDKPDAS